GGQKRRAERDRGAVPGAGAFDHRTAYARGGAHHGAKALRPGEEAGARLRGGAARVQRSADAAATGPGPAADPAEERRAAARTIRAANTGLLALTTRARAGRCGDWLATVRRRRHRRAALRRRTRQRRHWQACAA